MLRLMKQLSGYKISAQDEDIGKAKDFLIDDEQWTVRWLVADTGHWLPGRKVLLSPVAVERVDWKTGHFQVLLSKGDVESAPGLEEDAPVSRKYEARWYDRYGYPYYWGTADLWGGGLTPMALRQVPGTTSAEMPEPEKLAAEPEQETVLRSVNEVCGYHIQANDGAVGHVEDFIMDDETWAVRYFVVDTRNWLPGRKVLLAPQWMDAVHWSEKDVTTSLSREAVKNAPAFDPLVPVSREYEQQLFDYYGRPVYWNT